MALKKKTKQKNKRLKNFISFILIALFAIAGYFFANKYPNKFTEAFSDISQNVISTLSTNLNNTTIPNHNISSTTDNIPPYSDSPFITLNENIPNFSKNDETDVCFESYSNLDSLGRCGVAFANLGIDSMPTGERGAISHIHPSGWKSVKYDTTLVEGGYLYNRCHLIGFQLSNENDNKRNLITGTRYFNVDGMLPFENNVAEYIKKTKNHVLYRVTPFYNRNNLVASGVQIEAKSVEDNGNGILFNVYIYNIQPNISINYVDGTSSLLNN